MIEYVIHPGPIASSTDGQRHYITAQQLINLYKVNPTKCIVFHRGTPENLIHLFPKQDGNYLIK